MKFEKLLKKQRQLNEAIGKYPETPDQLAMAIIEECGEVSRELRADWRWWAWEGQEHVIDRGALIGELNDVLKFLLVGIICFDDCDNAEYMAELWGKFEDTAPDETAAWLLGGIVELVVTEYYAATLAALISLCVRIGITRDELEAAYLKKWEANMQRTGKG